MITSVVYTKKIFLACRRYIKNFYDYFFFKAFVCHHVTETEVSSEEIERLLVKKKWLSQEMEETPPKQKEKPLEKKIPSKQKENPLEKKKNNKRSRDDFINDQPSTSTAQVGIGRECSKRLEIISLSDSTTEVSDNEGSSPWTNLNDVSKLKQKYKCSYCDKTFEYRHILVHHMKTTCLLNPDSKTNKETGKYKCFGCGRNYKVSKTLRYHQKHECNRQVTCSDCGTTMLGTVITERHKQKYCVKKQRTVKREKIKQESPDELFIDDSSIDCSD